MSIHQKVPTSPTIGHLSRRKDKSSQGLIVIIRLFDARAKYR
jgi:hypothetical protein